MTGCRAREEEEEEEDGPAYGWERWPRGVLGPGSQEREWELACGPSSSSSSSSEMLKGLVAVLGLDVVVAGFLPEEREEEEWPVVLEV